MADTARIFAGSRSLSRRKMWQWAIMLPSLLIVVATFTFVVSIFLYQWVYAERIYLGVNVLGLDVGGMTPAVAAAHLTSKIRYYEDARLVFRYDDQTWSSAPRDLGAHLDARAAAQEAFALGRGSDIRTNVWRQLDVFIKGYTIIPHTVFDPAQAQAYVEGLATQIDRPARNATVVLRGVEVEVIPSQAGRQLDVEATLAAVQERILGQSDAPIDLVVQEIAPAIGNAAAHRAKSHLDRLLSAPIQVRDTGRTWTITPEMLAGWVVLEHTQTDTDFSIKVSLDRAAVRAWVEPLAPEIYQRPEDARLDFDPRTGQLHVIQPSWKGRILDIDTTVDRILAVADDSNRAVQMAVLVEKPAVDVEDLPNMGIVELVSQATTYFQGSPAGRIKNIEIAASKFNGVVIPPDGVFSFNRYLGDVSAEEGYEEAYIIKGNRTAVGIGGGVCQVSTTAFRAAFFGGFPIVERWAHGYRVRWYETNSIPGLDATIYSPLVDFKFRNDTGNYLLIETEVDLQAGTLSFFFYGTRPDREVDLEGPIITNETPPKEPVYEVDETLPPGTIKQIDWAHSGADVTVYRVIKRDGKVIKRERFDSHYQPWADVYLVGPGTGIPGASTGDQG